jgi:hypothetical protein
MSDAICQACYQVNPNAPYPHYCSAWFRNVRRVEEILAEIEQKYHESLERPRRSAQARKIYRKHRQVRDWLSDNNQPK